MSSYSSDFVTGPEDICFQLLLPCLIPVLKEEFRNMYRVAATTNKPMTTEEATARIEQMQRGRSTQDVMSLGVSFVRSPIMPRDFQKSLEQITKWNRFMIDKLYDRVCLSCGKQSMKTYIDALFYLKTQNLCWNANVDASRIQITIPDYASFIHLIAIHLARLLWELPGILESGRDYEQEFRRKDQFDHLVFQSVRLALAEKIPMSDILCQLSYDDHPMHHSNMDQPYSRPPPPEFLNMPPIQQQPLQQMHPVLPPAPPMQHQPMFEPVILPPQQMEPNTIISERPVRLLEEPVAQPPDSSMMVMPVVQEEPPPPISALPPLQTGHEEDEDDDNENDGDDDESEDGSEDEESEEKQENGGEDDKIHVI